jgi:hypothetical protein
MKNAPSHTSPVNATLAIAQAHYRDASDSVKEILQEKESTLFAIRLGYGSSTHSKHLELVERELEKAKRAEALAWIAYSNAWRAE